jgi:hypothetical protein
MRHVVLAVAIAVLCGAAHAQENVKLKDDVGRDAVENFCGACHSLDYVLINSPFLNGRGWEAEVDKMIKAFGAPIQATDRQAIIHYLTKNYGTGN